MIQFTVQGKPHEVDQERLSIAEAMEIKQATGLTVRGFLNGLKEYDVEAIVALVWLARSRAGERGSIKQIIASNFDLLADFDIIKEQGEEDGEEDGEGEGEPVPTGGATPPETASTSTSSTTPPSTPSTRTSTGRTGSARSRGPSATAPPRSTR